MLIPTMLAAAALAAPPDIQPPALRIGDRAPTMDIAHWVKTPGGVDRISPGDGNIYIVDFWATWCAPCIAGFPALSDLQHRFADEGVIVVALSDEAPEKVESFLELPFRGATHGARMDFVVATDPDGSVRTGVLEAMWKYYIPQSLVIDRDGTILWMGIPDEDGLESALTQILAGDYDPAPWRAAYEQRRARNVVLPTLLDEERWDQAEAVAGDDWERLNDIAARIVFGVDGAVSDRDLDRADRLASEAFERSGRTASFPLHLRGAIAFERGELGRAVEFERRAHEIALPDGAWRELYAETLARYEAALDGE